MFIDTATSEIYTLSLHDALPISSTVDDVRRVLSEPGRVRALGTRHSFTDLPDTSGTLIDVTGFEPEFSLDEAADRKSTRLNSSHVEISYAVFCLKKKKQ